MSREATAMQSDPAKRSEADTRVVVLPPPRLPKLPPPDVLRAPIVTDAPWWV